MICKSIYLSFSCHLSILPRKDTHFSTSSLVAVSAKWHLSYEYEVLHLPMSTLSQRDHFREITKMIVNIGTLRFT